MSQRARGRIVIIGAGPTGLGVADRLQARGWTDYLVIERAGVAGGLAASERDAAGFTWDLGGHVQFSHYAAYDAALDRALGTGWITHARTACVRIEGHDVGYPFQHHLHRLPEPHRTRALHESPSPDSRGDGDSFAAWLRRTFNPTTCDLFLEPYNRKVWSHPLDDMGWRWVGDRVARPTTPGNAERPPAAWGPNARFRYPASGGTGAIWSSIADALPSSHVRTRRAVVSVDPSAREVILDDGGRVGYDALVSTMPLDALVSVMLGLAGEAHAAAAHLVANTVDLVGVGVGLEPDESMRRRTWMYFPEPASPYYRVTVLSNYAAANAPAGCYSLLTESSRERSAPARNADRLVADTIAALQHDGLLPEGAPIRSTWHRTLPYGYPIPTRDRDEALGALHGMLEPLGIYSRGRFGGWRYEVSNQDHSYMQGHELADRLLDGTPEETYFHPDRVNGRYRRAAP